MCLLGGGGRGEASAGMASADRGCMWRRGTARRHIAMLQSGGGGGGGISLVFTQEQ